MSNLIAYIPVINRQYLDWVERHQGCRLHLVSQPLAENLIPRLGRNLIALPTHKLPSYFAINRAVSQVCIVGEDSLHLLRPAKYFMPDEDLSHAFAERYLSKSEVVFEEVWGRWDMTAVKRQEPVIPDLETSSEEIDRLRMEVAKQLGQKSPDWWRQIASLAYRGDELIACAYNAHYPTEYEVAIFGDPRINFDAGDEVGAEVYMSLHSERGLICECARKGVALEGATIYVVVFPCQDCSRWIAAAGIKEVRFSEGYSVLGGLRALQAAGIRVVKVQRPESA